MENIKWIFFDIGYTLVNEDPAVEERLLRQLKMQETIARGLTYDDLYNSIIDASINYQNQYKAAMKKLGLTILDYNSDLEVLYPDTISLLENLYGKYKLGIIANQEAGLIQRMKVRDIYKYFDVIISSHDVQLHKPDEKIFLLALSKIDAKPEECIMVGDRIDNDIYPAKKLGMKTIWIKQGFGKYQTPVNNEYNPDFAVDDLNQLKELLK